MNKKGQAYLEFLLGAPVVAALCVLITYYSAVPLVRQYVKTQLYEFDICRHIKPQKACRLELETRMKVLFLFPYSLTENSSTIQIEVPKWRIKIVMKKEGF